MKRLTTTQLEMSTHSRRGQLANRVRSRISPEERGQPCPRVSQDFDRLPRGHGCPRSFLNSPWGGGESFRQRFNLEYGCALISPCVCTFSPICTWNLDQPKFLRPMQMLLCWQVTF